MWQAQTALLCKSTCVQINGKKTFFAGTNIFYLLLQQTPTNQLGFSDDGVSKYLAQQVASSFLCTSKPCLVAGSNTVTGQEGSCSACHCRASLCVCIYAHSISMSQTRVPEHIWLCTRLEHPCAVKLLATFCDGSAMFSMWPTAILPSMLNAEPGAALHSMVVFHKIVKTTMSRLCSLAVLKLLFTAANFLQPRMYSSQATMLTPNQMPCQVCICYSAEGAMCNVIKKHVCCSAGFAHRTDLQLVRDRALMVST